MFTRALSLAALAILVAGCSQPATTPETKTDQEPTKATETAQSDTVTPLLHPSGRKLVVGFSQIGAESGWRTANTESIKSEAEKLGVDLKFSDAQQKQENQIKAIKAFIAQKVDVIAFSPVVEPGWGPVLAEAKKAGIPVIVSDRRPDVPEDMYVCFIGSDFVKEGEMAAEWLIEKTGGKAVIAELTGTTGSAPANDRKKGFMDKIKDKADMQVVFSQTGDFTRAKGKEVMEALLKTPDGAKITALYAHNDDMALGAIQAIEEAGKVPGKDIIIVSIDGVKAAFEAMVEGKLNCSVECNPLLGPPLFDTISKVLKGESVPKRIVIQDGIFDQSKAKDALPTRKY